MAQAKTTNGQSVGIEEATEVVTSVVIPVYNEIDNLPVLLDELLAVRSRDSMADFTPIEIIFVEDGSTDGTSEWIDARAERVECVRAIHLRRNWGQSAALAAGFDHARGEFVVPMDGDLQNDPADIPRLLGTLTQGYGCVSGYRKDRNDPWHKTIPSAIQTKLAKKTGPDINDFGCTLTAYRSDALDEVDLYGEEHRYIPAQLHDKGYSVTEEVVNHRERKHGESRYGIGRLVRGFSDLVFHWIWNRYSTRPFHFFGGLGFVVLTLGGLLGSYLTIAKYALGQSLLSNLPQLLLSVGMVLFGLLLVVFGVIVQFLTRIYYRDESEYRISRVVE